MSSLTKISIRGVRSFGPDTCDTQSLSFSPLTVILGKNGAGKTTIIESLRYATTGEGPSSKNCLVHAPKVTGTKSVVGQITLEFKDKAGQKVKTTRDFKAKMDKGKKEPSFEAMGGEFITPKRENYFTAKKLDSLMEEHLGVSKNVLTDVIFCHQDEGCWPLSDGKQLKEKFDNIFGTTRYNKAIESIDKLRKEQESKLKEHTGQDPWLEKNKAHANELAESLEETVKQLDDCKRSAKTNEEKLNRKEAEIEKVEGQISANQEVEKTIAGTEERITSLHNSIKRLSEQLGPDNVPQGSSLSQLQGLQNNYLFTTSDARKKLREAKRKLEKCGRRIEEQQRKSADLEKEKAVCESKDKDFLKRLDERRRELVIRDCELLPESTLEDVEQLKEKMGDRKDSLEKQLEYQKSVFCEEERNLRGKQEALIANLGSQQANLEYYQSMQINQGQDPLVRELLSSNVEERLRVKIDEAKMCLNSHLMRKFQYCIEKAHHSRNLKDVRDKEWKLWLLEGALYQKSVHPRLTEMTGILEKEIEDLKKRVELAEPRIEKLERSIIKEEEILSHFTTVSLPVELYPPSEELFNFVRQQCDADGTELVTENQIESDDEMERRHETMSTLHCHIQDLATQCDLAKQAKENIAYQEQIQQNVQNCTRELNEKQSELRIVETQQRTLKEKNATDQGNLDKHILRATNNVGRLTAYSEELASYLKNEENLKRVQDDIRNVKDEWRQQWELYQTLKQTIPSLETETKQVFGTLLEEKIQLIREEERLKSLRESLANCSTLDKRLTELREEEKRLQFKKGTYDNEVETLKDNIDSLEEELGSAEYCTADEKYRENLINMKTLQISIKDLEKYKKALEWAIIKYHKLKMRDINTEIMKYWMNSYKGNDIEYIEIKSEMLEQKSRRKQFAYRERYPQFGVMIIFSPKQVVMGQIGKGGEVKEMDMKGRCSAGQKVLASIIIRIALAETFCHSCKVLALDEPTTNLDEANKRGLAEQLREILKLRRENNQYFQLIVITHDEAFVQLLSQDYVDTFYRITKENQKSIITERNIKDL